MTESDFHLIPAIDLKPMTEEFFFSCIILSVPHIQGEVLQCSLHLYFQMLPLTSQPNSFYSPPPLPRATLLTPCTHTFLALVHLIICIPNQGGNLQRTLLLPVFQACIWRFTNE